MTLNFSHLCAIMDHDHGDNLSLGAQSLPFNITDSPHSITAKFKNPATHVSLPLLARYHKLSHSIFVPKSMKKALKHF